MSSLPWVRFFPSDWLAGTRGMTAAETGVYITLIAMMYERGEPIPEDMPRLARLCGASNSQLKRTLDRLLEDEKIVRIEGGLWNDRVAKEQSYRSEKSDVGRQAAGQRWRKDEQKQRQGDAKAMRSQCDRNAKPEARSQKPDTEPSGSAERCEGEGEPSTLPDPAASLAEDDAPFLAPAETPRTDRSDADAMEDRLRAAAGSALDQASPSLLDLSAVFRWLAAGCDLDRDVLPAIAGRAARHRGRLIRTWGYFEEPVLQAHQHRLALEARMADPAFANVVPFDPKGARHGEPDRNTRHPTRADDIDAAIARRLRVPDPG